MTCISFQERMQSLLFARQTVQRDDVELKSHLESCSECRAELQRLSTLADAIREWSARVPASDVSRRVIAAIVNDQAGFRGVATLTHRSTRILTDPGMRHPSKSTMLRSTSHRSLAVTLTGLAVLLAMTVVSTPPTLRTVASGQLARTQGDETGNATASHSTSEVHTVVRGIGSAYLAFVQDTAGAVNTAAGLAIPVGGFTEFQSQPSWIDGVGRGWEPIQKSVGTMIDTFLNLDSVDEQGRS